MARVDVRRGASQFRSVENIMLKTIVLSSLPLLLSACGTIAHFDPHFYMDEDAAPRWFLMTPQPNR